MEVPIPENASWWDDEDYQDSLAALLVYDLTTLKSCGLMLSPDDFKPLRGMKHGNARWMVTERALEHYETYHEPLGKMVRADVLEYANSLGLGAMRLAQLKEYLAFIAKLRVPHPDSIIQKVVKFKTGHVQAAAIQELNDTLNAGMLTPEKWHEISQRVVAPANGHSMQTINYTETVDARVERRRQAQRAGNPIPWTFIDPLDALIRCVGRKQIGLILAPYKRGKSMFLLWLAVAYTLQRLRVLYITLEDPKHVVEDRLDSIVTHVPLKVLHDYPQTLKKRFNRYRSMMKELFIYDGTEGGVTVPFIEQLYLAKREEGFLADVILVDYDEEVEPVRQMKDKRMESDETYRSFRRLNAKYNSIGWLAAQTQRNTRHMKILSGDVIAEDIGKVKKVGCALSLGKGEWTKDSYYLWVAAHKNDRMDIGCEIVPDLEHSVIYDREATLEEARAHANVP